MEDTATNHLWERQAAAGDEAERTVAGNGWQKWAAAIEDRDNDPTMTAGAEKNGQTTVEARRGSIQHNNLTLI